MRRLKLAFLLVVLALLPVAQAFAQATVLQGGPWTQGHIPQYVGRGTSQPVIQDGGGAGGGAAGVNPAEQGLTARGTGTPPYVAQGSGPYGTIDCDYDAPITNATGYHYLCFSPNARGGGLLAYGNGGTASALPLSFIVNGVQYAFPFTTGGYLGQAASTQIFTSSGTFTVPLGIAGATTTTIQVELQAAGGGGGASADGTAGSLAGNPGAGGGAGGWAVKTITGLTPGATITVTLGAAGVGGTGVDGTTAATSTFGSSLSCTGGTGGVWGVNTSANGGAGGTCTGGDITVPGGGGGFTGANSAVFAPSEYVRVHFLGGSSRYSPASFFGSGAAGTGYGGGGGGATGGSGLIGGNGAPALCIVRW